MLGPTFVDAISDLYNLCIVCVTLKLPALFYAGLVCCLLLLLPCAAAAASPSPLLCGLQLLGAALRCALPLESRVRNGAEYSTNTNEYSASNKHDEFVSAWQTEMLGDL